MSGTPDDSTRLCVRLPPSPLPTSLPSPSVLYLSPSFPSFTAYRLFARAIVSRRVVVSRRSTDVYDRLSGESGVRANPVDGSNPPDIYCRMNRGTTSVRNREMNEAKLSDLKRNAFYLEYINSFFFGAFQ